MAKSGRRRGASASASAFAFFHVTSAHASFFSHAGMEKKETTRDKEEGKEGKGREGKGSSELSCRYSFHNCQVEPWQITLSSIMKLGFSAPCVSPISCLRTPRIRGKKAMAKFLSRRENCPGLDGGESGESV